MHEFALMESTLLLVEQKAKENGLLRVKQIGMNVGELSGAMPDALLFAFDVLAPQVEMFQKAKLRITEIPALAKCTFCNLEYKPDYRIALCPQCQLPSGTLINGEELEVEYIEGEDESNNEQDHHGKDSGTV